jgi:hypothetical protein
VAEANTSETIAKTFDNFMISPFVKKELKR